MWSALGVAVCRKFSQDKPTLSRLNPEGKSTEQARCRQASDKIGSYDLRRQRHSTAPMPHAKIVADDTAMM